MESNSTSIAIIGCGVMGISIAATALGHAVNVTLVETDQAVLQSCRKRLNHALRHGRLMSAFPKACQQGEIEMSSTLTSIRGCSSIIEAVNEDLATKVSCLQEAEQISSAEAPIITNTSSIPIEILAANLRDPGRLIGVHFMNPSYLIDMVEVVRGRLTSSATLRATEQMLSSMNRVPISVRDSPGFVTSRLLHAMINDAANLVGEGVATANEVDALMKGCLGHRTGPLQTADLIGLDNLVDSLTALFAHTNDTRYIPSPTLIDLVAAGCFGQKARKGFYEY